MFEPGRGDLDSNAPATSNMSVALRLKKHGPEKGWLLAAG